MLNSIAPFRKTRRQRYTEKQKNSINIPVCLGIVNFTHDGNLAFLIRSAICFGISDIHVIGSIPSKTQLNSLSGSTYDWINLIQHKNPNDFLAWTRENKVKIISAELTKTSRKLCDYKFNFNNNLCIFTGHETTGVPTEILINSDVVEIDMPGPGFCLNTTQAANIVIYEATKQFLRG